MCMQKVKINQPRMKLLFLICNYFEGGLWGLAQENTNKPANNDTAFSCMKPLI